jgi:hypothetical protein
MTTDSKPARINVSIHPNSQNHDDRMRRMKAAEERFKNASKAEQAGMFNPNSTPGKRG